MSTVAIPASSSYSNQTFVQRYAVPLFFVLAFAMTWAIQIPIVLDQRGMLPFHLPDFLVVVQGPMPGIAALIMAALASGRVGVKDLLRRVIQVRVGIQWYLIALFGTGAVYVSAVFISARLTGTSPDVPEVSLTLLAGVVIQLLIYLVFNWEDIAWRGFATTRLQAKQSALVTALILGVVEGLFHIPLFFAPNSSQASSPFWAFMVLSIGGVVLLNWVFNSTAGSVFIAMLFHAAANTWTDIVPFPQGDALGWTVWAILFGVIAVAIVILFGARWLARNPNIPAITVVDPIQTATKERA